MSRAIGQDPVGNGWTLDFYSQQPQSSVITGENVWRLANQPYDSLSAYTFDAAPASSTTEVLALMRRDATVTAGVLLRVANQSGYAVSFEGETGIIILEIQNGVSTRLIPRQLHEIPEILTKWVWIRARMESSTISMRAWAHGSAEPSTWLEQRVIVSPVVNQGFVGRIQRGSSSANNTDFAYYAAGIDGASPDVPVVTPPGQHQYAEAHYVTQAGAGTRDGATVGNAFSVSGFNNSANWDADISDDNKIGPDDIVYFSGTITSTILPQGDGTDGYPITLDGYAAGSCDHLDGADTNAALITVSDSYGIQIVGNSYLVIQDFRVDDCSSGIYSSTTDPSHVTPSNIIIRRNSLDGNTNGIYLTSNQAAGRGGSYITIEDNEVVDTAVGDTSSGKAGLRLANHDDLIIRRNHVYQRPAVALVSNGQDGIMTYQCRRVLVEYNRVHHVSEDCIDVKNDSGTPHGDYIIRFNVFYDARQSGITLQHETGSNAYVYGNFIYGVSATDFGYYPFLIQRGFENVAIWANVIQDARSSGIAIYNQDDARPVGNAVIYNNTIVNNRRTNTDYAHGGIALWHAKTGTSYAVKNNILVDNAINDSDLGQLITLGTVGNVTTENYNLYYLSSGSNPKIYWNATSSTHNYSLTDPVSGTTYHTATGQGAGSRVVTPGFVDYSGRNLRLSTGSAAIGAGAVISNPSWWSVPTVQGINYSAEVKISMVLDPETDWTTTIPSVVMEEQGSAWDIGAYSN